MDQRLGADDVAHRLGERPRWPQRRMLFVSGGGGEVGRGACRAGYRPTETE
jgi:hypothetical protein